MSNLEVLYVLSHFEDKAVFTHLGKIALKLDRKDFSSSGYGVNEERHPTTASKASGRKGKAVAPSLEDDEQEEEQKIVTAGGSS